MLLVVATSIITKLPRFLQFKVKGDGTGYKVSDLMGDPIYIRFNSCWDEIFVTGIFPLLLLTYFNLKIFLKVTIRIYLFNHIKLT